MEWINLLQLTKRQVLQGWEDLAILFLIFLCFKFIFGLRFFEKLIVRDQIDENEVSQTDSKQQVPKEEAEKEENKKIVGERKQERLYYFWTGGRVLLLSLIVYTVFTPKWSCENFCLINIGIVLVLAMIYGVIEIVSRKANKSFAEAEKEYDTIREDEKRNRQRTKKHEIRKKRFEKEFHKKIAISIFELVFYLITVGFIWSNLVDNTQYITGLSVSFVKDTEFWIILFSYVLVTFPVAYLMRLITVPWQKQLPNDNPGLHSAGKWIGIIERVLILTFILINSLSNVGFLISAKSIIRFGEIRDPKNRKGAEYILIGTLLSFGIAIIVGIWAYSATGIWIQDFFPEAKD